MKKILLVHSMILFSLFSSAQNFLINQNFSNLKGTIPPSGWQNITVNGDTSLDKFLFDSRLFHFAPPFSEAFAIFDAYNGGSAGGTADNKQPEEVILQLSDVSTTLVNNLSISFSKQVYLESGTAVFLEVSTDTGNTWTTVWTETSTKMDAVPVTVEVGMNSYKGFPLLQLRFRWKNTSTADYRGFFALDNVALFERYDKDVRPSALIRMYNHSCPDSTQPLEVEVTNAGTDTATNVSVEIISGAFRSADTIPLIAAGRSATIVMPDSINTTGGGTYTFTIITTYSSDLVMANDTLRVQRISSPTPATPDPQDVARCGTGSVSLTTARNTNDSTYWFSGPSGGVDIGGGNPFETPEISTTTTYYCENARVSENEVTSYIGLYRFNGGVSPGAMFNVHASNDIIIDSISQHFAYSGTYDMRVFIKNGTYRGSETTSGNWKELDLTGDTLLVSGYGRYYTFALKEPLRIPAGDTVAFYVDGDRSSITFTLGKMDIENPDLRLEGNTVLSGDFGGVTTNYYWNGSLLYRKVCSTKRFPVTATVLPVPTGASLVKGSVFEGQFRVGSERDPDVLAEQKTLEYEIIPPTGFNNSGYGTNWIISEISLMTENGTHVPAADTSLSPPGASNGTFTYRSRPGWADSLLVLRVVIGESTNQCDTTLIRYLIVVPTPVPDFSFRNVCDGEVVSFLNRSTVSSGYMTFYWDMGDGSNSTSADPIHIYDTFGSYYVTLTATTNHGIVADTTFRVEVFEIPNVDFEVESACEGVPVKLTNTTTIGAGPLTYKWDLGDGNSSVARDIVHQYTVPNTYAVTLEAFANGCSNKITKNAALFARPAADFTAEGACSGNPIHFTNTSTISNSDPIGSYWRFGDATVGTLTDQDHIYTKGGVYDVELVAVTPFGCKDSLIKQITILAGPLAAFTFEKPCENFPVDFKNLTKVPQGLNADYKWYFGDGDSSTQTNPSHLYATLGEKTVVLTAVSGNGCGTTATVELKVSAQPKASFTVEDGCSGSPVQFVNTTTYSAGNISYKWYFGDKDSSDFTSPTHIYNVSSTSTFNVSLKATIDSGCVDESNRAVTIEEPPVCKFTAVRSATNRAEWTFIPADTSYDAKAYTWVFEGSGTTQGVIRPTHLFEFTETEYRVILQIISDNGCICIDSTTRIFTSWGAGVDEAAGSGILVYPNPAADYITIDFPPDFRSKNAVLKLSDFSGKAVWSGDADYANGPFSQQIPLVNLASGIYFLQVTDDNYQLNFKIMVDTD